LAVGLLEASGFFASPPEPLEEPFEPLAAGVDGDGDLVLVSELSEGRGFESVTYQPDPLKMIPAGWSRRRMSPPHDGQTLSGSSPNFWRRSTLDQQPRHSYS
jgi:hypothetical protein